VLLEQDTTLTQAHSNLSPQFNLRYADNAEQMERFAASADLVAYNLETLFVLTLLS
jgi:hypothetical protein